jgi:hypothetical protein
MLWEKLRRVRLFRTLRFRLASTFLLLLAVVLALVGLVGTITLRSLLEIQSEEVLHEQLAAMRGYIQFDDGRWKVWEEMVHRARQEFGKRPLANPAVPTELLHFSSHRSGRLRGGELVFGREGSLGFTLCGTRCTGDHWLQSRATNSEARRG